MRNSLFRLTTGVIFSAIREYHLKYPYKTTFGVCVTLATLDEMRENPIPIPGVPRPDPRGIYYKPFSRPPFSQSRTAIAAPAPAATGTGTGTATATDTDTDTNNARQLDMSSGGATMSFGELGPVVVNVDGSLSRVGNWGAMSEIERANTLRILGKRNQERLRVLREREAEGKAEGKGEGEGEGGSIGGMS
ncbi:hypothetical protein FQN55_007936 [Onygenales sp. PD_40]|nr:hypothetical protein FQN55_007936 [Onygenales sp. PD_40]